MVAISITTDIKGTPFKAGDSLFIDKNVSPTEGRYGITPDGKILQIDKSTKDLTFAGVIIQYVRDI